MEDSINSPVRPCPKGPRQGQIDDSTTGSLLLPAGWSELVSFLTAFKSMIDKRHGIHQVIQLTSDQSFLVGFGMSKPSKIRAQGPGEEIGPIL